MSVLGKQQVRCSSTDIVIFWIEEVDPHLTFKMCTESAFSGLLKMPVCHLNCCDVLYCTRLQSA